MPLGDGIPNLIPSDGIHGIGELAAGTPCLGTAGVEHEAVVSPTSWVRGPVWCRRLAAAPDQQLSTAQACIALLPGMNSAADSIAASASW